MNCLLVEPVLGQIIGVYMEIDHKPGVMTYVGVVLIMVAINVIHKGSPKNRQEITMTEIAKI